jgi:hypothetical protein
VSDPTTVVKTIDFVGTFEELLTASEPAEADLTLMDVFSLPNTKGLEERYALTIAGPHARLLAQFLVTQAEIVIGANKVKPDGSQPST